MTSVVPGSIGTVSRPGSELRVGVIGAGAMGEAHLRAYASTPGVRIVGLATRTPERAAELARRYEVEATFADARALIDETRPDGVSVTTGEHDHVEPTCYALERGVGVLVEKPIASSVADAERIAETARTSGSVLLPGHILRFTLPYRGLKAEVASGRIGEVIGIAARRDRPRAIAEHYRHVHPAFLTAVHDIDLALWLTGSRVIRVRALEHRQPGRPQPDIFWAQAVLASGALATIATAYLLPGDGPLATSDRIEVYGTEGIAVVDLSVPVLAVHAKPGPVVDWLIGPADGSGAFGDEIAHFCACLRDGRPSNIVTINDAVAGIRIADAMVRSVAADGGDIWL